MINYLIHDNWFNYDKRSVDIVWLIICILYIIGNTVSFEGLWIIGVQLECCVLKLLVWNCVVWRCFSFFRFNDRPNIFKLY